MGPGPNDSSDRAFALFPQVVDEALEHATEPGLAAARGTHLPLGAAIVQQLRARRDFTASCAGGLRLRQLGQEREQLGAVVRCPRLSCVGIELCHARQRPCARPRASRVRAC